MIRQVRGFSTEISSFDFQKTFFFSIHTVQEVLRENTEVRGTIEDK